MSATRLSLRQVEDLLFERGIDICHETVRYWWNRFGPLCIDGLRSIGIVTSGAGGLYPSALYGRTVLSRFSPFLDDTAPIGETQKSEFWRMLCLIKTLAKSAIRRRRQSHPLASTVFTSDARVVASSSWPEQLAPY